MKKLLTITIIHQDGEVLLGMKKRGLGAGYWNGFGGKVQAGETIENGARRELTEEAGISANDLVKVGILEFTFENDSILYEVHVFKCTTYTGKIGESEEMCPKWFDVSEIPFKQMWKDDIFWFPHFLANEKFLGSYSFDTENNIIESKLRVVERLESR